MLLLASLFLESSSILGRNDERLNHLGPNEVSVGLIQLVQPEVVAVKICVRRIVRIPAQVTEVLRQNEGAI